MGHSRLPNRRYRLTLVAETDGERLDFGPYAPAIGDDGTVAFTATDPDGRARVFLASDGRIRSATDLTAPDLTAISHPDLNARGDRCAYVEDRSGRRALVRRIGNEVQTVASVENGFADVGPLGPTVNDGGAIAFRASRSPGTEGVYLTKGGAVTVVAEAGDRFARFEGLPVVLEGGDVVFRAERRDGVQGIYVGSGEGTETSMETGAQFASLGRFPAVNRQGDVAFAAEDAHGEGRIVVRSQRGTEEVVSGGAFASYRGALIGDDGAVLFFATPIGGSLGVYAGPNPETHRVLEIGQPLFGALVEDFALNAVSLNRRGQVAIRIRLDDGRQCIAVADPEGMTPRLW